MIQFTPDEWFNIVQRLELATDHGRVSWSGEDDPFSINNGFQTTIAGNATYVLRSRDYDGTFPFVVKILDQSSNVDAEFETVPFEGKQWPEPDEQASETIARLYLKVKRLVTGAPQKARSLLDDLDGLLGQDDSPF